MILSLHDCRNPGFKEFAARSQRTRQDFFDHQQDAFLSFLSLCMLPCALFVTSSTRSSHSFTITVLTVT